MAFTFEELQSRKYKGYAWTVSYEFEANGFYWGCDGSSEDEPNVWFFDKGEAIEFARQNYPVEVLIEMLEQASQTDNADTLIFTVEQWEWFSGLDEYRNEEDLLFIRLKKHSSGEIVVTERQGL